jgi:hypothetical protein
MLVPTRGFHRNLEQDFHFVEEVQKRLFLGMGPISLGSTTLLLDLRSNADSCRRLSTTCAKRSATAPAPI